MQSQSAEHQPIEVSDHLLSAMSGFVDLNNSVEDSVHNAVEAVLFHGHYEGSMEMSADAHTVAKYLDAHQEWFHRCSYPMKTESLGDNGYTLVVGRFGSFGYEVEPKIGLDLLPQDEGVYRIKTIPVPNYQPQGYDVDFGAVMELVELASPSSSQLPTTQVEWNLNLEVTIQFPRFIHALPKSLVQNTGDRLLNQIVRQVSRRLTQKVQADFHQSLGLPLPKSVKKKHPWVRNQGFEE